MIMKADESQDLPGTIGKLEIKRFTDIVPVQTSDDLRPRNS